MQRLVYILVYPLVWFVSILPFPVLYFLSDCIYVLLYHIVGYRKKVVKNNIRLVFPEKSEKEVSKIATEFFSHLCDITLESIKSLSISEKQLIKRYQFTNPETINKLEATGQNIIVICAHYANWEWIFVLEKYLTTHRGLGVYKRLANKYFDGLVRKIRAKYNTEMITTKETIKKLLMAKKMGDLTITGFIADQSPKVNKATQWQDFMGINVPVHIGTELIAKKTDSAVVLYKTKKVKRGHYESTFIPLTTTPKEYPNYQITKLFLEMVEEQIKEAPQYYLWSHKRWKHRNKSPNLIQK